MVMLKLAVPAVAAVLLVPCARPAAAAEGNMIGSQSQNEGLDVVPSPRKVVVDGISGDGEWDFSGRIWSFADWDARDVFSVKTSAMWDAENLYLFFDWRDPFPLDSTVDPRQSPSLGWREDAVQMRVKTPVSCAWVTTWGFDGGRVPAASFTFADNRGTFADRSPTHSRLLFAGTPGETELGDGVALAYRLSDDRRGFTQEMRIPWRVLRDEAADAPPCRASAGDAIRLGLEFHFGGPGEKTGSYHAYIDNMQPGVTEREFFWNATHAWGEARLLSGSVPHVRQYSPQPTLPQGTIEVRARVPANREFCTVAIDDASGRRVRNLAGGVRTADCAAPGGAPGEVLLKWDGLDDAGRPVAPGRYILKTLGSDRIDGFWERSFYNPGDPPWSTSDGRGAWGADHMPVRTLCAAGDAVVCCSGFAEGGYGTFALKADGRKLWSDKRGSFVAAGDERYVFIVPNDWSKTGRELLRIDAKTGGYRPFSPGADMPVPLSEVFGLKKGAEPPRVLGLALCEEGLLALCADNALRIVDPERGVFKRAIPLHASQFDVRPPSGSLGTTDPGHCPFAARGGSVYTFFGRDMQRTDVISGRTESLPARVESPLSMAFDAEGSLYVADDGPDQNVKVFSPDGALLREIGRRGGRAREGALDRSGFLRPSGVAVDSHGRLWVAEKQEHPRRVSVWTPDGGFLRDFLGNGHYSGAGTAIHRNDPARAFASQNEISFGPDGSWDVAATMFGGDACVAGKTVARPGGSSFHGGDLFFSYASGKKREFFAATGDANGTSFFIGVKDGLRWRPVAAISSVAALQGNLVGAGSNRRARQAPWGEWEGLDAADVAIWNDFDGDGFVSRGECEIVSSIAKANPAPGRTPPLVRTATAFRAAENTEVDPEDLGFWAAVPADAKGKAWRWGRMVPSRFRDGGLPVYSMKEGSFHPCQNAGLELLTLSGSLAASPVPGKDLCMGFLKEDGFGWLAAWRKSDGAVLWRYPSPFHGVHGSHKAPMAQPGLLIGPLKVMGVAAKCGVRGDMAVAMIRGNLGEDYFVTDDGLYVNRFTKDGRLPGMAMPEDAAALARTSFATLNGWWEPFCGTFARQDDGVARATCPLPATQGGNVVRIEGLEKIERGLDGALEVSEADLARAAADRDARNLAASRPAVPLVLARSLADAKPHGISAPGQPVRAVFRGAADEENLKLEWTITGDASPWVNCGKDWRLLFKTGDCVDFQFSPRGNRKDAPLAGDFRLLAAPFGEGAAAVLMRQVAPDAPAGAGHDFTSPVTTVHFDEVRRLAEVPLVERLAGGKVRVSLSVPWRSIGVEPPTAGAQLSGDVGFILSSKDGTVNAARVYRSNKNTGLVSDQPGEARLEPRGWSEVKFKE